ncbi:MAG: Chromosomal replication initiator protein DnaA [candidate division WS2 bacterium]|nr:Chromosomal replication initiator protein DnaA [Candidatus Psychracetigena formicireducens]
MARPLRIEYENACYHITSRGNERKPIYLEEKDYYKFLDLLSQLPQRFGVIIHGYVLMANHYHLLLETPLTNMAKTIHYLNATYSGYFNRKYGRVGHLFQGRYKGILIDKNQYLLAVSRYIHLNPLKSKLSDRPEDYLYSSYSSYIGIRKTDSWLTTEWVLGQFSDDLVNAHAGYQAFVEEGLAKEDNPLKDLKAGFILGGDDFVDKVKNRVGLIRHREIPQSKDLCVTRTYEEILTMVSVMFGVGKEEILIPGERNNFARKVSIYLLRKYTHLKNMEIAQGFGVGYTAVSQVSLRLRKEMEENPSLKSVVQGLEGQLSE